MKGFRCPACGQAHEMVISHSMILKMNEEMNDLQIYWNDEKQEETDFFNCLDTVERNPDLQSTCCECKEENPVHKWKTAFEDPLMFFEMESLCHCGGELWMDQIPHTQMYGFVCEDCGWVKPRKTVSGA